MPSGTISRFFFPPTHVLFIIRLGKTIVEAVEPQRNDLCFLQETPKIKGQIHELPMLQYSNRHLLLLHPLVNLILNWMLNSLLGSLVLICCPRKIKVSPTSDSIGISNGRLFIDLNVQTMNAFLQTLCETSGVKTPEPHLSDMEALPLHRTIFDSFSFTSQVYFH